MQTSIVVPVYNEERRLKAAVFVDFIVANPTYRCLFVNDGSTDGTKALLEQLCRHESGRLKMLDLAVNSGKAEAVRRGLAQELADSSVAFVGYLDADLSTLPSELPAFVEVLRDHPEVVMVLGSRVKLLGRSIGRRPMRHYLGRVFATMASLVLDIPVYDTQCGAKVLRATEATRVVVAQPFQSRWIFDVEIIARLAASLGTKGARFADLLVEIPLQSWHEVPGSKVRWRDFFVAAFEMASIHRRYRAFLR